MWFAYVNAESTLAGFDTFLCEYNAVLEAMSSGVSYVGTSPCRARVESGFAQRIKRRSPPLFSSAEFLDYCAMQRNIETGKLCLLTVADVHRYRGLRPRFSANPFVELYARWIQDGDVAVHRAAGDPPTIEPCPLRVHELGLRYDP